MKKNKVDENYPWYKYYKNIKNIDYPNVSMYEMIKESALKYPNKIAYTYYKNKVTYKNLLKRIDEVACAFIRMGIKKGDYVSIIMPNTPEAIICFYALNKISAICNLLHPLYSEEELKYAINITNTKYIVTIDSSYKKVKKIKDSFKNVEKILYIRTNESMDTISSIKYSITKGRKSSLPIEEDTIPYYRFVSRAKFHKSEVKDSGIDNDISVILHSNGTTGNSKAIVLTNLNFNTLAVNEFETNRYLKPGISVLSTIPIFNGYGIGSSIHSILSYGSEIILSPFINSKNIVDMLLKHKPNIIITNPSMLEHIHKSKKLIDEDLSYIKNIICVGESLSQKTIKDMNTFLYDHGSDAKVTSSYGMSECISSAIMMPKNINKPNSIGIPLIGTIVKIVKPNTEIELPYNEVGEICINSKSIMKEYINDKEETKKVLIKHKDGNIYLHSKDLGYMDKDGFIYFKSNIKRLIISNGYKIYPNEIEEIILKHPYVEDCAIVGVPHPYKKEVIKAYIVLKKGLVLNSEIKKSIKEHCEKNIASYALPYAYGYRKELPKTLIGKVSYKELISDNKEEI